MVDYSKREKQEIQMIIDRNYLSKAQRIADDTKEELSKVLKRVENVKLVFKNKIKYLHTNFINRLYMSMITQLKLNMIKTIRFIRMK